MQGAGRPHKRHPLFSYPPSSQQCMGRCQRRSSPGHCPNQTLSLESCPHLWDYKVSPVGAWRCLVLFRVRPPLGLALHKAKVQIRAGREMVSWLPRAAAGKLPPPNGGDGKNIISWGVAYGKGLLELSEHDTCSVKVWCPLVERVNIVFSL